MLVDTFTGLRSMFEWKGESAGRVGEVGERLNRNWREGCERLALHEASTLALQAAAVLIAFSVCFSVFTQRFLHICGDSSVLSLGLQIIWLNIKSLQGKIRKWTYRFKSQRWIEIKKLNPAVGYRKQDLSLRSEIHTELIELCSTRSFDSVVPVVRGRLPF